jgi:YbgC/YbaW family acyl-CoA thioester hydrolase
MIRSEFRFVERLRVRWSEVDMQKIVFNGHYLMYFDTAVAGYWRAMAMPYHDTMAQLQGDLFVRKATLEYLGSARYDEQLQIGVRCARIGNSSMSFDAAVFRADKLLVHGELIYVFADPETQTSQPVPPPLRDVLQGFEAGQAMWTLHRLAWSDAAPAVKALRQAVFVEEMELPAAQWLEDADDKHATHVLARNRFGQVVGAARLLAAEQGTATLGRIATLPAVRGAGVGRALLAEMLLAAQARGDKCLLLQASADAAPFYAGAGFVATGQGFEQAGVQHVEMQRWL